MRRTTRPIHEDPRRFMKVSRSVLLRKKNVREKKIVEKIEINILFSIHFPPPPKIVPFKR